MKDIEIIIRRTGGKVSLTVINNTDKRKSEYSYKDISKSPNIKECCDVLLEGFSFAIDEIENKPTPQNP